MTTKRIDPATAQGQLAMYRAADRRILDVCKTFNEIQIGPNPLSPEQVRKLIDKRSDLYGVLEAWASKP